MGLISGAYVAAHMSLPAPAVVKAHQGDWNTERLRVSLSSFSSKGERLSTHGDGAGHVPQMFGVIVL
jgi:hypothetical protein